MEQLIGLSLYSRDATVIANVSVHGHQATLYRVGDASGDREIAFSWVEAGCEYSVLVAAGTSTNHASTFAARY